MAKQIKDLKKTVPFMLTHRKVVGPRLGEVLTVRYLPKAGLFFIAKLYPHVVDAFQILYHNMVCRGRDKGNFSIFNMARLIIPTASMSSLKIPHLNAPSLLDTNENHLPKDVVNTLKNDNFINHITGTKTNARDCALVNYFSDPAEGLNFARSIISTVDESAYVAMVDRAKFMEGHTAGKFAANDVFWANEKNAFKVMTQLTCESHDFNRQMVTEHLNRQVQLCDSPDNAFINASIALFKPCHRVTSSHYCSDCRSNMNNSENDQSSFIQQQNRLIEMLLENKKREDPSSSVRWKHDRDQTSGRDWGDARYRPYARVHSDGRPVYIHNQYPLGHGDTPPVYPQYTPGIPNHSHTYMPQPGQEFLATGEPQYTQVSNPYQFPMMTTSHYGGGYQFLPVSTPGVPAPPVHVNQQVPMRILPCQQQGPPVGMSTDSEPARTSEQRKEDALADMAPASGDNMEKIIVKVLNAKQEMENGKHPKLPPPTPQSSTGDKQKPDPVLESERFSKLDTALASITGMQEDLKGLVTSFNRHVTKPTSEQTQPSPRQGNDVSLPPACTVTQKEPPHREPSGQQDLAITTVDATKDPNKDPSECNLFTTLVDSINTTL